MVEAEESTWIVEFAALADASASEMLKFARHSGPVRFCEHGLPSTHVPERVLAMLPIDLAESHAHAYLGDRLVIVEPVEQWRQLATEARAILHIAHSLAITSSDPIDEDRVSEMRASAADLTRLLPMVHYLDFDGHPKTDVTPTDVDGWRRLVAVAISTWLDWGDVRARFDWTSNEPQTRWSAESMFGTLALQLALAAARCDRFAVCAGCRTPYETNIAPQVGRDAYCEDPKCKDLCQARYQRRRRAKDRALRLAKADTASNNS